ncbi:HMG box-containing protein C19G7,04 [Talaromyces islandicus]|uniref:HMG box-containing protein C19G7,04 n=1 Tax=Talaromyces islandicus TaxID=28573 RepID=A0A0U1LW46_TALIS|nr:HMG box-containing protein C19G7,04 [Talaromyces islandicus]
MARLNASNPVGQYARPNPARPPSSLFSKTAHTPLKPRQRTKKPTGSLNFKIFEDAQSADEEAQDPHSASQTAAAPLKLAHANSITSGLSKRASQESSGSASDRSRRSSSDEEESSDKENIFIEDEAEEASEEEEESEDDEPEEETNLEGYAERDDFDSPQPPLVDRQKPSYMRYRAPAAEVDSDTQSERSADDEDGYGSLDDFIVSDNEDISYHDSEDGLPDEEEDEDEKEEVKPPSPKPLRRRLLRGRKPRESGINLEKLTISEEGPAVNSSKASPSHTPLKDKSSPRVTSSFTRLLPDAHSDKATARAKTEQGKRSPLRESINSLPSVSDSPTKKPPDRRMETPPPSPSKVALPSPSKTNYRIPPSPHRQSSDAFWSQDITNSWNDQWSPPKKSTKGRALERLLAELELDLDEDSSINSTRSSTTGIRSKESTPEMNVKSPSKTALKRAEVAQRKEAAARKKAFDDRKSALAQNFLTTLDEIVSGGQVQNLAGQTGGVRVIWSKTLRSTAGRARWKRERINQPDRQAQYVHHASIELAERIIDDEDRLLNTLAHEYCHLANFMISGVRNQPHGASFKTWGRKCTDAVRQHPEFKKYPVEVTTKHSYKIDHKYVWICVDCGKEYGRHSKSIDPAKSRCSLCKGGLQQIKPKPRNMSPKKSNNNNSNINIAPESVGKISLG